MNPTEELIDVIKTQFEATRQMYESIRKELDALRSQLHDMQVKQAEMRGRIGAYAAAVAVVATAAIKFFFDLVKP
jgi:Mg2+ and Co2+ transporter CorA